MNLKNLASLAGVSVSTVSKAFNDAEDISEKTRNRVFEIAREYGCYAKYKKNKYPKKVVGVICHELNSEHYAYAIEKMKNSIESRNGIMLVSQDDFDLQKTIELADYYSGCLNVDAIISFSQIPLSKTGIDAPVVCIGNDIKVNWKTSMTDCVKHLSSLNHKNIAFACDMFTTSKMDCFAEVMNDMHMPLMAESLIVSSGRFEEAGRFGADVIVKTDCTAIICAYDYIAFGMINRLNELGYDVPGDYSVIGMDNIRASNYYRESLTTISYPFDAVCDMTVDLVFEKMKNKYAAFNGQPLETQLVVRGSTSVAAK